MTTKEWLNRGFDLSRIIQVKKACRDTLINVVGKFETDEGKTDHTRNTSEDAFIKYSEAQREIERLELELRNIDHETDETLRNLKNVNEYTVLYSRYVVRLSWKEIEKVTNFSQQHVFKLHADGVKACGRYMDSIKKFWG